MTAWVTTVVMVLGHGASSRIVVTKKTTDTTSAVIHAFVGRRLIDSDDNGGVLLQLRNC